MEKSLWMVEMQTLLTGSMDLDWRGWTLYSSVNLRRSSGVVKPWNSFWVWSPKLRLSTRKSTRLAPAYLMRRYTRLQAMKVLPLPVAICTKPRGRPAASDCSRLVMARAWAGHRPSSFKGGMVCRF